MTCVLPLVLLVEDDPDTAALYRALLGSEGMEVVHCSDCGEAHRWWHTSLRRPDLVVMDVRLPDGNGLDLLAKLRAEPWTRDVPVVIISVTEKRHLAPSLGAVTWLTKPVDGDELRRTLNAYARRANPS